MAVHDGDSLATRGAVQANVAITFLVLAWCFVALRVWTRTCVIANFGWDDFTMVISTCFFTVYCAAMLFMKANGGGTHIVDVKEMILLTKWTIIGEATYLVTIMMLKISLGIFFARIVVLPWQLRTIYTTVAVNVISSAASFFYVLLRCGPDLDGYVYKQFSAFTTVTDLVFAILPIFILWNAHMSVRSKVSVGLILSLAGLGSVCSMVRFQYVDGLTQIADFFWNATNIAIWSTIEPGAGIVAGCLATLRPLLKRFLDTARSMRSSASRSTKENSRSSQASSNPKGFEGRHTPGRLRVDRYAGRADAIELKSDASRKGCSTDYILSQLNDEQHLEFDQHSLPSNHSRYNSTTKHSSRIIGDALPYDRRIPPPPGIEAQHSETV